MLKNIAAACVLALCALPAVAKPYAPAMQEYLENIVSPWAHDPVLIAAIKAQNQQTADYSEADVQAMDTKWQVEVIMPQSDLITPITSSPAAEFLRGQISASGGAITEAFIIDARGLNVAVSQPTSDYWQGDEAKYQQTFLMGPDAFFIDDVELDKSTGAVQGQVSVTLRDPETGAPIGVLTVGIDLKSLS